MRGTSYLIGLGSNRGAGRHPTPDRMLAAALAALADAGLPAERVSRTIRTRPLGGHGRRFANAAALVVADREPLALLALLKTIERALGRRPGRRWGDRPIDLDILAWNGGTWRTRTLHIPHPGLALRPFALVPAAAIAPDWRHGTGVTLRQHAARLRRPRPRSAPRRRP